MATITIPNGGGTVLSHKVYAKTQWSADWELRPNVYCEQATWSVSPSLPTATLRYRYGPGRLPDSTVATPIAPLELPSLAYTRVELVVLGDNGQTTMNWYGIAGVLVDQHGGTRLDARTGVQYISCVGLEWLLSRHYIDRTYAVKPNGQKIEIDYPYEFQHNRSKQKHGESYLFTEFSVANSWFSKNVIEYLLTHQVPRNSQRVKYINWKLDSSSEILTNFYHVNDLKVDRNTTLQLLNQLLPRQRGVSFYVEPESNDANADVLVKVISYATDDVKNGASIVLKKNTDQNDLDLSQTTSASPVHTRDSFASYSRVRVRGARAIGVFSLSVNDGNLEKDWTADQETEYQEGASNDAGYPAAAEKYERQLWNNRFRDRLQKAYRQFKVPDDWNGMIKNADGNERPSVPALTNQQNAEFRLNTFTQILPYIPLRQGVDYVTENGEYWYPGDEGGFQSPFCVFKIPGTSQYVDTRFNGNLGLELANGDRPHDWSAAIVPRSDEFGLSIEVNGRPQHVIDGANFTKLAEDPDPGDFDYSDAFFTVAIEAAQYLEIVVGDDTNGRVKQIDATNYYKAVYLAAGTVVGIKEDGTLDRVGENGRWIMDTTANLEDIGNIALSWYGSDRNAISFSTRHISNKIPLGSMINNLIEPQGNKPVNTVVTSITFQSSASSGMEPPPPQLSYQTENAELDATNI